MTKLDLNLLKVLRVLLEVNNTRRASEILFTSQSSVSKALSRLRDYFNDELFTREHHGLIPTPKALELAEKLPMILDQLDSIIDGQSTFEAMPYTGKITIAINSFIANWLSPRLFAAIASKAPQAQLNLLTWDRDTVNKITGGEVHVGINYFPLDITKKLIQRKIGEEKFVLLCKKQHPLKNSNPNLDEVKAYGFASLVVPDWNESKPFSEASNSNVQLRSSYLDTLLNALDKTNLLLPVSLSMAEKLTGSYRYLSVPDVLKIPPVDFAMTVSNNKQHHPLNVWLQQIIRVAVCDINNTNKSKFVI